MIYEKIKKIICDQLGEVDITKDTRIIEDLDGDSVAFFQIINDIEDEFDIRIEDTEDIVTVGDAVQFVEEYMNNR